MDMYAVAAVPGEKPPEWACLAERPQGNGICGEIYESHSRVHQR